MTACANSLSCLLVFAVVTMLWSAVQARVPACAGEGLLIAGLNAVALSATPVLKACHRCCGKLHGPCIAGCVAGCHAAGALAPDAVVVATITPAAADEAVTAGLEEYRWCPDPLPPRPSIIA